MTATTIKQAGLVAGLALGLVVSTGLERPAGAADLKQLAEQLVNLSPSEIRCRNPQTGKEIRVTLRNGVLVDGTGREITDGSTLNCDDTRIAIQEEGANVKKEKGVEDVD